ncbi:MAG TPA: hypothetical protein VFU37_22000 [Pyrinomonadaceae bacterium]|nr:hypothetical protein [Pyrinomonadaceae bacterium]
MISLSLEEVERRFALLGVSGRFTSEEKEELLGTTSIVSPGEPVIGFATPKGNSGLNILDLRHLLGTNPQKQPSFFDHPWYLEEAFASENCAPGWHYIHTSVLPESISQPFNYADSFNRRGLDLPSAIEVTLMLFLHYVGTGEQLLQKKHTWCKDQASMNRCVTIGAFGRNGLFVSGHPKEFASRGLGICAKIRR